jgi:hypothetical protein
MRGEIQLAQKEMIATRINTVLIGENWRRIIGIA